MATLQKLVAVCALFLVFSAVASSLLIDSNIAQVQNPPPIDVTLLANAINMSRIQGDVANLSSLQSRVTGYPGCVAAANYIEKTLSDIGLKVERHNYSLLVPVDQETNVTILPQGTTYEAYALWPNDVQACPTPPGGIEGRIQYVGKGRLVDFDGLDVKDSIVLMDFESEDNWLNAAKLGAKAAIFIEPVETIRTEAEQKFTLTPINFPRIYLPRNEGIELLKMVLSGEVTHVNIKSKIQWQPRIAENIIAIVPGQVLPDEIIMANAYYDSRSVVPKLSPGAEEAVSPAVLLELARLLHTFPPRYTVWLVFYSGHWQAMAGGRNFVEDFFFQNQTYATGTKKIRMDMGVQLSSDSNKLGFVYAGDFYSMELGSGAGGAGVVNRPLSLDYLYRLFFGSWIPSFTKDLSINFSSHVQNWQEMVIAKSEFFESEIVSQAGVTASTFLSTETLEVHVGTPFDTVEKVSWANLKPQILFVSLTIVGLANQNYDRTEVYSMWRTAVRFSFERTATGGKGYAGLDNIIGRVEQYNLSSGFYNIVPGAMVEAYRLAPRSNIRNPFTRILTLANEKGEFKIAGVKGYDNAYGWYSVLGYLFDSVNGSITYAPDLGMYGAGGGTYAGYDFLNVFINAANTFTKTIVFKCNGIVLYDVINPLVMRQNRPALNFYTTDTEAHSIVASTVTVKTNDFISHSAPSSYGLISPTETGEPIAMLFVDPKLVYEVVITTGAPDNPSVPMPVGLLINASEPNKSGYGYSAGGSKQAFTGFDYFKDFVLLNEPRLKTLVEYKMLMPSTREYYTLSRVYYQKMSQALNDKQYSKAYDYMIIGWNYEANAYIELKGSLQDLVRTAVLIFALMVPFAIIFERLVLPRTGLKRFIEIVIVLMLFAVASSILHPGFALASNIIAVVLGICILVISVPVVGIIFGNFSRYAKELRSKILGAHFADIARGEALLSAITTGVAYMRKRPLRTFLNLLTVSIIIFSLVAFTSATTFTFVAGFALPHKAPYSGMMLSQARGKEPFSPQTLALLASSLGPEAIISPRSWVYLPSPGESDIGSTWTGGLGSWTLTLQFSGHGYIYGPNGTKALARALFGVTPEEFNITEISLGMVTGRYFTPYDKFVCILPQTMQLKLGAQVGDSINIKGINLKIVGVADPNMLRSILDLDGNSVGPLDPQQVPGSGLAGTPVQLSLVGLPWDEVVIVPFELAYNVFDGRINNIAVKIDNVTRVDDVLRTLVFGSYEDLEVYVSTETGNVEVWRRAKGAALARGNIIAVPVIIGALTILVTLIGSVEERRRQITVLSTVGLSPLHVTGLFLAESLTYAVMGSLFGYLAGLAGIRILVLTGFVPEGMTVNFSSSFVLIAIGFSMLLVMLSSLYPALRAGFMVTPSLKRKWEIASKPLGDDWTIQLPFVSNDEEVDGVVRYLSEFLDMYTSKDMGKFFVTSKEIHEDLEGEFPTKEIIVGTDLPPWDSNTNQKVFVRAYQQKRGKEWYFQVHLKYLGGSRKIWMSRNPGLVDILRKQLLIWRAMNIEEKMSYTKEKHG